MSAILAAAAELDAHRRDLCAEAVTVSFASRGPNTSAAIGHYTVEIEVAGVTYSASAKYPADAAALARQKAKDAAEAKARKVKKGAGK